MAREHVREVAVLDADAPWPARSRSRSSCAAGRGRRRPPPGRAARRLAGPGRGRPPPPGPARRRARRRRRRRRPRRPAPRPTTSARADELEDLLDRPARPSRGPAGVSRRGSRGARHEGRHRVRPRRLRAEGPPRRRARPARPRGRSTSAPHSTEPVDYPPICAAVGRAVVRGDADRGIVLGGAARASRSPPTRSHGVRAALCNDLYTARLSREHNDANVLSMGGRIVASAWPTRSSSCGSRTPFEGGRHQRRVAQIAEHRATSETLPDRMPLARQEPADDDTSCSRSSTARSSARTPRSS